MDQCMGCTAHGDILACNRVFEEHGCSHRETWWAVKIQKDHDLQRRRLQGNNNDELVRRRKAEFEVGDWKARSRELEVMFCQVYDELNDPMGEYWCEYPASDRKLLESLLARVKKVVYPKGEPK